MKKVLNLICHQENSNLNHSETLLPEWIKLKRLTIPNVGKDVKQLDS